MAAPWSQQSAQLFWSNRIVHVLSRDDNLETKCDLRHQHLNDRECRDTLEKQSFSTENSERFAQTQHDVPQSTETTSANLKFWIENSSWTYCDKCFSLTPEKLLPRYAKRSATKNLKKCLCAEKRYVVPSACLVPQPLLNLSFAEICILRPFDFHNGEYHRLRHGYRQKNGMSRVTWSTLSVEEKIDAIADDTSKQRCEAAYNFLMNSEDSCYSDFVAKRTNYMSQNNQLNLYDLTEIEGIECALWPHLYPTKEWCESILQGNVSRLSRKISFYTKVLSNILDYSLNYELLQYHYDMWIFKTVSGAISTARKMKCSPARALNAKIFSAGYWKAQHRLLIDAVDQFGYPDVFITISPFEWSFPFPPWVEASRNVTGRGPTGLAGFETLHIAHVLEQLVRGYLCGSNDNRWSNHVFSYHNLKGRTNINTYFYRFEFQQRGTVHLHLLIWLKNITKIQHSLIRADVPWENRDTAYLVNKLQRSDKTSLKLNNNPTSCEQRGEDKILSLFYPQEALAVNLRAYISTVLPALQCRMDFQVTDGRSMVLRYVTSYVAKWHDAYSNEALYSTHINPYQAAYRHLKDLEPCEPEMWLHMSPIKFSWSNSRTKHFFPPTSTTANEHKVHQKYIKRPPAMQNLSFLQWLRSVNHVPANVKPYTQGHTLVSVKFLSPFNDQYYFQELLMNYPHRSLNQLQHPRIDSLPEQIRHFASAVSVMPTVWTNQENIRDRFQRQGNKEYYVDTLLSHVSSLHDMLYLWQKGVLTTQQLSRTPSLSSESIALDNVQFTIVQQVMHALHQRDEFYDTLNYFCDESSSEEEEVHYSQQQPEMVHNFEPMSSAATHTDWKKFTLVTGKAGVGKSQVLLGTIERCVEQDRQILVACPTGILAGDYRHKFASNVTCETIHSAFNFPFVPTEEAKINWGISRYDIVILDELSMVSKRIANHVIRTIGEVTIRPVVLVTGDPQQIQPIETVDNKIKQVPNILHERAFYNLVYHYTLSKQYRVLDLAYEQFLDHIRFWQPSQQLLDRILESKIICEQSPPSDAELHEIILQYPDATILTFTRQATTRINNIVINTIFDNCEPLAIVQCDYEMQPIPIYKNMRVIVTQNRNKDLGIVNGALATVHAIQNATIFLKLRDGKIVNTYRITYADKDHQCCTCYPFTPSYALTIAKAQGQTLKQVILWFDIKNIPNGFGYVALSRIRHRDNLMLLTRVLREHCIPVPTEQH